MMRALVRTEGKLRMQQVPRPRVSGSHDVLIRVHAVGICRTDVYVADGRLPAREPLILGHEFSGTVCETGASVWRVNLGDRVSVLPWVACRQCDQCRRGAPPYRCLRARMLGVDRDGAFAEWIVVPEEIVYAVPADLPLLTAAYAEPVAASLAILNAELARDGRGLLYGDNRIALLTYKILQAHGFADVTCFPGGSAAVDLRTGSYDWAIETVACDDVLDQLMRAVRPGGKIVLKSRPCGPVRLDVRMAVLKDLTLQACNYGSFTDAIDLLARQAFDLTDLLGPVYPLDAWEEAFAAARTGEGAKCFLLLEDAATSAGC